MTTNNVYPATERQVLEWEYFLDTGLRPGNINHMGIIDDPKFDFIQIAFDLLMQRHDGLRTTFTSRNGELLQIVCAPEFSFFELRYVDFSDKENVDFEINRWYSKFCSTIFTREGGRVFDAAILLTSKNSCVIALTMDHLISDAMSVEILKRDFSKYYQQLLNDRREPLEPLSFQMKEYAMWERKYNKSQLGKRNLQYWKNDLSENLREYQLSDKYRPTFSDRADGKNVGVYNLFLKSSFLENRGEIGENKFLLVISSLLLWLSIISGQENIILGIPFSARESSEMENVMGYLILGIYLRVDLTNITKLEKVLPIVLNKYLEAIEHRHYSRKELGIEIDPFCAAFVNNGTLLPLSVNYDGPEEEHFATETSLVYPVNCKLMAYNNGWLLSLHYNYAIFGNENNDRIFGVFKDILDGKF